VVGRETVWSLVFADYLVIVANCGKERKRNERNDEEHGAVCEKEKTGSEC
jgi:hypothetical protein